jgi:hypothetical protein
VKIRSKTQELPDQIRHHFDHLCHGVDKCSADSF